MKKTILFLVILALLVPASAFAATEFSLGGYIKLDTFWDSTQNNALMLGAPPRDNSVPGQHGRFDMRANESRFNFTIKGPKLWGATTTGFIEMDFDGTVDNAGVGSSGTWIARLRHAMFRLNWPETELMFGQYWGLFSNWWIESAEDGPFLPYGSALDRIPQIRLTQKFAGDWAVAGLMGMPQNVLVQGAPYGGAAAALTNYTAATTGIAGNGQTSETPQFQGQIKYEHDWWGKAPYYGHPIPFTATVSGGWERAISRNVVAPGLPGADLLRFGENGFNNLSAPIPAPANVVNGVIKQSYVSPWMVQGAMFIPVIPTYSNNLAGTASVLAQAYIGEGVEAFGITGGASNVYKFEGFPGNQATWGVRLMKRWGMFAQGQYYFTNEWFVNAAYGLTQNYGVNRSSNALAADQFRLMQTVDATLWYRPIAALKFGIQYSYCNAKFFQKSGGVQAGLGETVQPNSNTGNEHRVEGVAIFYF